MISIQLAQEWTSARASDLFGSVTEDSLSALILEQYLYVWSAKMFLNVPLFILLLKTCVALRKVQ